VEFSRVRGHARRGAIVTEFSIVGIGGTTRPDSSGERMTRAVLAAAARRGARTQMFGGAALQALPHFAPESLERTKEQLALVEAVRAADGLVICSPGYHGGVSGLVKNAIDLLEDLRDDRRSYFDGRAVGLIVVAAGWQACGSTLNAMRSIVHAMRGWPTPLGITVNVVAQRPFGEAGDITDVALAELVEAQAAQILGFADKTSSLAIR
jgi:FMN reductase